MRVPHALTLSILAALVLCPVRSGYAEVRTYRNPSHHGYRLDYCQGFGQVCGEPVATQWCRGQGYEYASDWVVDRGIGAAQTTVHLDDESVCEGPQCESFATITCGREGRSFRLPNLGAATRATVIMPDRRGTAPTVMPAEVQLLVPGCHQREPGMLLCETIHEYQHCRTLLREGTVLGCRAGLAFEGAFAQPRAVGPGTYELSLRSRASATVYQGRRGEGRLRGQARYEVRFAIPEERAPGETCLQRDRYAYHPTGPEGGHFLIDGTDVCDEPIAGAYEPHEDDLLRAYDLCSARGAWGERVEISTDLLVAGLFQFGAAPVSEAASDGNPTYIIAPYITLLAPMRVDCKD